MRGRAHSEETRAAVMAALLAGQGIGEVARAFNLDPSVVSRWRSQIPKGRLQEVATKKELDFAGLLCEYLGATLESLAVQARFFGDPDWLKRQDAADLAVLHGIQTDKAILLLRAAERAGDDERADELS